MKMPSMIRLLIKFGEGKESKLSFQITVYIKLRYRFPNADILPQDSKEPGT